MAHVRSLAVVAACALCACSTLSTSANGGGHGAFGADAKENYELGQKEVDGKNYLEAERYFEFVSAKFPYSSYSALADLAMADLEYAQEKYVEAIDKYRNFIKLHPTHPKDGYAAFQVGMSYYESMPSDFFFLPNSAEKDQTDTLNALSSFNEFLIQYPTSDLRPKAQEKVADLRHRLADHEMRIGKFYWEHDRPRAAAGRYETVLRDYPGAGFDGDAALALYTVYEKLDEKDKAKAALEKLVKEHPDDPLVPKAKKLLGQG